MGALSGGAAALAKAVDDLISAKYQLKESKRHDKTIEVIAMGKVKYLWPHKNDMDFYLKPHYSSRQRMKMTIKGKKNSRKPRVVIYKNKIKH